MTYFCLIYRWRALEYNRTPPGSGLHINYQLLQFAAPAAALRTSRAIIGPNLIEYILDDLFLLHL